MVDRLGAPLTEVANCSHCGTAHPNIYMLLKSDQPVVGAATRKARRHALYVCNSCAGGFLIEAAIDGTTNPMISSIEPQPKRAHEDLPERARTYLDQAFRTLSAPDAAAVMAGSAVDAMLKELGYDEGTVYTRIDQALADHRLTDGMARWAHAVRLGANRPRHADNEAPHVSPEEARQSVDFAEALGSFLFVLTARIERGVAAAES